jgi:hypothetical protein
MNSSGIVRAGSQGAAASEAYTHGGDQMSYLTEGDSVESSNCLTHRIHSTRGR